MVKLCWGRITDNSHTEYIRKHTSDLYNQIYTNTYVQYCFPLIGIKKTVQTILFHTLQTIFNMNICYDFLADNTIILE